MAQSVRSHVVLPENLGLALSTLGGSLPSVAPRGPNTLVSEATCTHIRVHRYPLSFTQFKVKTNLRKTKSLSCGISMERRTVASINIPDPGTIPLLSLSLSSVVSENSNCKSSENLDLSSSLPLDNDG